MTSVFEPEAESAVAPQWKKHWFVLSDAGLKYYRDSSAEEVNSVVILTLCEKQSMSRHVLICQKHGKREVHLCAER